MTDPCVVCAQNAKQKPKPGVFLCLGCQKMLCTQHVTFHRQELAIELNLVIGDRNELQEKLGQWQDIPDVSGHLNLIDEWVKKTVEQVYQIADNVRQQVIHLAKKQKVNLKDQFAEFSKQLDTFRENENFYEKDIENLKEKCICLKRFLDPIDIHVITTDISSSLADAIILKQKEKPANTSSAVDSAAAIENLVKNKKPSKQIQIPHDGSIYIGHNVVFVRDRDAFTVIDLKTNSLQSIRLQNSYYMTLYWSTYLNGFLCTESDPQSKVGLLRVVGRNLERINEFSEPIEMISCMFCHLDRMMLICCETNRNNRVEEWDLQGQ